MKCTQCNKIIESKWSKRKFCSRSCSSTFKNLNAHSTKGKGRGKPICATINCNNRVPSYGHKFCKMCNDSKANAIYTSNPTKFELTEKYLKNNHRSSAYSYIRSHAREVVMKDTESVCAHCSYSKHTEICHIKPIQDFDDSSRLNEINDKANLIRLCPNCHWEYDNGLLNIW